MEQFELLVKIQGGNAEQIRHPETLPTAQIEVPVIARAEGYVHEIRAQEIGTAAMLLGAGRETKEDLIDYASGIHLEKKVGDRVENGDVALHSSHQQRRLSGCLQQGSGKLMKSTRSSLRRFHSFWMSSAEAIEYDMSYRTSHLFEVSLFQMERNFCIIEKRVKFVFWRLSWKA